MGIAHNLNAFILAAGKGTRLYPLTKFLPKPLFPLLNEPAISKVTKRIKEAGIENIAANCHHLSDKLISWNNNQPQAKRLFLLKEDTLLDTGGGIKNAFDFFGYDRPLLVYNSDILTNIDLSKLYEAYNKLDADAILCLHDFEKFNKISCNDDVIVDFSSKDMPNTLAYTGVSIFNPILFKDVVETAPFGLIPFLKEAILKGKRICFVRGEEITEGGDRWLWHDIGTPYSYLEANFELLDRDNMKNFISDDCRVLDNAVIGEKVIVGQNAIIEGNVYLEEAILWPNAIINKDQRIKRAIITPFFHLFLEKFE